MITVDDTRLTHGDLSWHGNAQCFKCATCSKPLVDQSFLPKGDDIFCSKHCFKIAKSRYVIYVECVCVCLSRSVYVRRVHACM